MPKLTKAQVLHELQTKLSLFVIPQMMILRLANQSQVTEQELQAIKEYFGNCFLAIRSSANDEDGLTSAKAGEYESVLNVDPNNKSVIQAAIQRVINSYLKSKSGFIQNEILIQEMVCNVSMSGVIFTHELNTGAPYYVINYDDETGLTNTVTSGDGLAANRTLYIHRNSIHSLRSDRFKILIEAVQELEKILDSQFLDIEFALDQNLIPYLFQVRAITTQPNWNRAITKRIDAALTGIRKFVTNRFKPMPGVFGSTTVLGQMPDWNPAEMIGRAPRALAFSLYKKLITDNAWRIARERMSYQVPVGQPLMVSLAGQPFIDTRLSFHSFLPKLLDSTVCSKIIDTAIARLKQYPELHDKVEFDVLITAYSFDIDQKIDTLYPNVLTTTEKEHFKRIFFNHTYQLIVGKGQGSIEKAITDIEVLSNKYQPKGNDRLSYHTFYQLIDDCIQLGTIPFSILARHGFIAKILLLSLQKEGIISQDEMNFILGSLHTVASDLIEDMQRLQLKQIDKQNFMAKYGHLRPGTYDILSNRYDQMLNFDSLTLTPILKHKNKLDQLSRDTIQKINNRLKTDGFADIDANRFLNYIKTAIEGREYGKFVFTKVVSDLLELVAEYGEQHGLSREELSHLSIDDILQVIDSSSDEDIEERLRRIVEENIQRHEVSVAIRLPQVLFDEAGVHVVPFQVSHPNYITQKKITAQCIFLDVDTKPVELANKIILIENADPGFDWIFSEPIAGLVTKYGGVNSHMAIRCAEFGIPAAIGCGEQKFEQILKAQQLLIDCGAGLINIVH